MYSIGNSEKFNYYILKKDKDLLKDLDKLFKDLNIFSNFSVDEKKDKKGEVKLYPRNIFKLRDIHEGFEGGNKRVDIFYGSKRIYLTLICNQELRKKFNEELSKITKMVKPKKKHET